MGFIDRVDAFIDSRLPQSPEATARRQRVAKVGAVIVGATAAVGLASVAPVHHTAERVTVETGDTYEDIVLRGQQAASARNPHIDPTDLTYKPAAAELQYETKTNTGSEIMPGQEVSVKVTQGLFYGAQDVTADLTRQKQ
jgi:hypothetical protein